MTKQHHPTPAAKPRSNPNTVPVQLHPASLARDYSGRPTGIFAGPHLVSEGMPVLTVDEQFRRGCEFEGRDTAQKVLSDAVDRFLKGGGRAQFDALASQLARAYENIAIERELARGYRDKAKELTDGYGDPDEVLKHEDAATEAKAKAAAWERQVPVLTRQLHQERDLVQRTLQASLQAALTEFQREHLAEAARLEQEALAAFLPTYAQAVSERIIAQSPDRLMMEQAAASVALDEPKRPDAMQLPAPPSIFSVLSGAAS